MPRKLSAKVKRERAVARKAARELEDERKARRTDGVEDICNGIAQPITRFFHKMNGYNDVKEKRNCSAFEKNAPKKKKHKMVVDKMTNKENVDGVEDKKPAAEDGAEDSVVKEEEYQVKERRQERHRSTFRPSEPRKKRVDRSTSIALL